MKKTVVFLVITFVTAQLTAQVKQVYRVPGKPINKSNTTATQNNNQGNVVYKDNVKLSGIHNGVYNTKIYSNGAAIPVRITGPSNLVKRNYPATLHKTFKPRVVKEGAPESEDRGNYIKVCKTTFNKLSVTSSEWDVISLSTIDNVKIGSVFSLLDLQNEGRFKDIQGSRNPANLLINAKNVRYPIVNLSEPTEEAIINANAQLLNTNGHSTPQVIERTIVTEVYDESSLKLQVGLDVISPSVTVNSLFNFSAESKTEKFLIDYKAEAFTMEYKPTGTGFFQDAALNGKPDLVYVDKLVYGTRILVAFESDFSNINFGADLDVEVRSSVLVNVDALFRYQDAFKNTTFKIFCWGVNQGATGTIINATGIPDLKSKVAVLLNSIQPKTYYPSSWGLPISYSLRALSGETIVANAGLDELPQRNCVMYPKAMNRYTVKIDRISTGSDCELFGIISMQCFSGNQEIVAQEGNGLLTEIDFNQALPSNGTLLRQQASGVLGNSRVYTIEDVNNVFFRIWTDVNDRDVRPNTDDYLFITGGKCGVQVGNRQYCYQDFKLSDLIGRNEKGNGLCEKNSKIIINSRDKDGDSPLYIELSVCQGY